ncbi:GPO family capsid scaffolding protein [Plesiomonas shigelloides]|uniref:GPO family capsid scaffolding protein n=1 Tax=Plesiomonas shigelloides TaxID=703 RepID=UPI00057AA344|nr:GPO family capsid scaffolding protein [Plesiomonas shigelloides]
MPKKAQFKKVALSGQTTDGREIQPEWLLQAAKNYDPNKYGARVNMEHFRSIYPDSAFRAYGDVLSLKTEEVEVDGEKRTALFAEIDPTDDLIQLNKLRQKVYTSIELDLDFAGTGEAYLVGLAVTDSPASLGTEMLTFCANAGDKSPLIARKQRPENLFSCAIEAEIEFTEASEPEPSLLDKVRAMFKKNRATQTEALSDVHKAVEHIADEVAKSDKQFSETVASLQQSVTDLTEQLSTCSNELASIKSSLEQQEQFGQQRPPATGGDGQTVQTDC